MKPQQNSVIATLLMLIVGVSGCGSDDSDATVGSDGQDSGYTKDSSTFDLESVPEGGDFASETSDLAQVLFGGGDGPVADPEGPGRFELEGIPNVVQLEEDFAFWECSAVNFDGSVVAVVDFEGALKLWDVGSVEASLYEGAESSIAAMAFSEDGSRLITGGGELLVWDVATGKIQQTLLEAGSADVSDLCLIPDTNLVVSSSPIQVWNFETGELVAENDQFDFAGDVLAWSSTGHIAVHSGEGRIALLDGETLEVTSELAVAPGSIKTLVYAPDGKTLALVSDPHVNGGVAFPVWDTSTGQRRHVLFEGREVVDVCFSPDGRFIASMNDLGVVRLRTVQDGTLVAKFNAHLERLMEMRTGKELMFVADGSKLVTRGKNIRIWDTQKILKQKKPQPESGPVARPAVARLRIEDTPPARKALFGPDGSWFVVAHHDGPAAIYETETGSKVVELPESDELKDIAISLDGELIAMTDHDDKYDELQPVIVWNRDGTEAWRVPNVKNPIAEFLPDNRLLVRTQPSIVDEELLLCSESGQKNLGAVGYFFAGARGQIASIEDQSGALTLWSFDGDTPSHRSIATIEGNNVNELGFSPDGTQLCVVHYGDGPQEIAKVQVWDVASGKRLVNMTVQESQFERPLLLPDQNLLVQYGYGHGSSEMRVIDLKTSKVIRHITNPGGEAERLVGVSPDGRTLVSKGDYYGFHLHQLDDILNDEWSEALSRMNSVGIVWSPDANRPRVKVSGPQQDADLQLLKLAPVPFRMSLNDNCVIAPDLSALKSLDKLEVLDISMPGVTDAAVPTLLALPSLKSVTAYDAEFSDEALQPLRDKGVDISQ